MLSRLPGGLRRFLQQSGIEERWYENQLELAKGIPRYIRIRDAGAFAWDADLEKVEDVTVKLQQIKIEQDSAREFLAANGGRRLAYQHDEIWAVPHDRTVSLHETYKNGSMHGMDAASMAAVQALEVEPGQAILDLCCAPGAKLLMIGDQMQRNGILIGVDVSKSRLDSCAGVARQYRLGAPLPWWINKSQGTEKGASSLKRYQEGWYFALAQSDGREFDLRRVLGGDIRWDSATEEVFSMRARARERSRPQIAVATSGTTRGRLNKRFREDLERRRSVMHAGLQSKLSENDSFADCGCLATFDRVIVDVQCTHEGSLRHVFKHLDYCAEEKGWNPNALDKLFYNWVNESNATESLQRDLILRGLACLKPGGKLVYSTCSFSERQNESIVKWAVENADCSLQSLSQSEFMVKYRDSLSLPGSIYFDPQISNTSGLFVAKLVKL